MHFPSLPIRTTKKNVRLMRLMLTFWIFMPCYYWWY